MPAVAKSADDAPPLPPGKEEEEEGMAQPHLQDQLTASLHLNQQLARRNAELEAFLQEMDAALPVTLGPAEGDEGADAGTMRLQEENAALRVQLEATKAQLAHLTQSFPADGSIWRKYEALQQENARLREREAEHWRQLGASALARVRPTMAPSSVIISPAHPDTVQLDTAADAGSGDGQPQVSVPESQLLEAHDDPGVTTTASTAACQTDSLLPTDVEAGMGVLKQLLLDSEAANARLLEKLARLVEERGEKEASAEREGDGPTSSSTTPLPPKSTVSKEPIPVIYSTYCMGSGKRWASKANWASARPSRSTRPASVSSIAAILQLYLQTAVISYKSVHQRIASADMLSLRQSLDSRFTIPELGALSSSILDNIIAEVEDLDLPFISFNDVPEEGAGGTSLQEECMYIAQSITLLLQNVLIDACKVRMILNQVTVHLAEEGADRASPSSKSVGGGKGSGEGNWVLRRMLGLFARDPKSPSIQAASPVVASSGLAAATDAS
jgi:hypothetical protein